MQPAAHNVHVYHKDKEAVCTCKFESLPPQNSMMIILSIDVITTKHYAYHVLVQLKVVWETFVR